MSLRDAAKAVLFHAGGLYALHRLRNPETLTVIMLHRVLPKDELIRCEADPLYTVTPAFLACLIAFLRRHYNLVNLGDVLAARTHVKPLPSRALLITFDDGWRDNLEYALPVLRASGLQGVLFATTDAVAGPDGWWQDILLWALRSGQASVEELWRLPDRKEDAPEASSKAESIYALLLHYSALNQDERNAALARLTAEFRKRAPERAMLTASDLRKLQDSGVAIGAHSAKHLPLTFVLDPGQDIRHARDWLRENVDCSTAAAMSFPHGRYDRHVVEAARSLDYKLMFTSDAILNLCPGGWIETDLLGRIPIEADPVARAGDGIIEPSLAAWLFLREKRTLSA